jgi:homogentisate 1,2-dioxygenase
VPHRGPIGANGLANPEYFESPTPYVDKANLNEKHTIVTKSQNTFYEAEYPYSPFDVYAWKGNYTPYRFNLDDFVPIIAGNRDHLDPSSHIVLAVDSADGENFVELVCFAPRF